MCPQGDAYRLQAYTRATLREGAAIVGPIASREQIICFNVSDSRAYRYGTGQLARITPDDVPKGEASPRAIRLSREIKQSLGGRLIPTRVQPHISCVPALCQDEVLLLCGDGLTDMVSDGQCGYLSSP